jgi:hypothetical protein
MLGGWAYGAIYSSSRERTAALYGWLWNYNQRRPHGSLSHKSQARSSQNRAIAQHHLVISPSISSTGYPAVIDHFETAVAAG